MSVDNWTQLGVSGLTLGILFFIVRYFVNEMQNNRQDAKQLTEKFIAISEENIKMHTKLSQSIDANTIATKENNDSSKLSSDKLTELILKLVIK